MIITSSNVLNRLVPQSKKVEEEPIVEAVKVEKVARKNNKVKKSFIEEEAIPSYREED